MLDGNGYFLIRADFRDYIIKCEHRNGMLCGKLNVALDIGVGNLIRLVDVNYGYNDAAYKIRTFHTYFNTDTGQFVNIPKIIAESDKFKFSTSIHGTEYYESGNIKYKGTFSITPYKDDTYGKGYIPYGYGEEYYESGNLKYEGEFQRGLYDGQGTLYKDLPGKVVEYQGTFKDGIKQ